MYINNNSRKTSKQTGKLKIISWNINGVTGNRDYLRLIIEKHKPEILFLCESKRRQTISQFSELAVDDTYRVVQIKNIANNRGGMIAVIRTDLQLVTAEALRLHEKNDFAQAKILIDKDERAYIGW